MTRSETKKINSGFLLLKSYHDKAGLLRNRLFFCWCVIAINPKVLYHFKVMVLDWQLFAKCGIRRALLCRRNQGFWLMLKKKISVKCHFIDSSNEYKFIYVPTSSSSEKKSTFDQRWALFYSWGDGWSLNPMWQTVVKTSAERKLIFHVTEACNPCDKLSWLTHFSHSDHS